MTISITITDAVADLGADRTAALLAAIGGNTTGTGTGGTGDNGGGGGGTTTLPPDTNTYPLLMPTGVATGAAVNLGVGPDSFDFTFSTNPGSAKLNAVDVIMNFANKAPKALAKGLIVSAVTGSLGGQLFTINGSYGEIGTDFTGITIAPSADPAFAGMLGFWLNVVNYNAVPLGAVAGQVNDSRGGTTSGAAGRVFDSAAIALTYQIPNTGAGTSTPPVVAPTNALAPLLAAAVAGGTTTLPSGQIFGTGELTVQTTLNGAGMGITVVDCTNTVPFMQKGCIMPAVAGTVISNMTIQGAAISVSAGNNGAGVRDLGDGIGFTLDHVEITNCQDGILTFKSNIVLKNCNFHGNGANDGFSHNMYVNGTPTSTLTLTDVTSTNPIGGHAVKSRAGNTTITGSTITSGGNATAIDIPDGGTVNISNTTITVPAGAANRGFYGYALESVLNGNLTTTFTNVTFVDQTGVGAIIQGIAGSTVVFVNCTYVGAHAPTITGFATVTGTITAAPAS